MPDVAMPRLSDAMEDGTIVAWLVDDGEHVVAGQEIVEIETDKATMSFESELDGELHVIAHAGDVVLVGAAICRIDQPAEAATVSPTEAPPSEPAEPARRPAGSAQPDTTTEIKSSVAIARGQQGPKASPVARRVARERGIDIAALAGSGPGGRIVRADVERAAAAATPPGAPPAERAQPAPAPPANGASVSRPVAAPGVPADALRAKGDVVVEEPSRQQQVVMRRMSQAKATIPDFSIATELDAHAIVALREQLRGVAEPLPSINDLVVKACAIALREFPRVNGGYLEGKIERYSRINVGVAVATDDALMVPTIFDADAKGLQAIASQSRTLAAAARDKSITPPQLSGGTFTVSNLGMFGITHFTAIINPPQAAILAVGSLRPQLMLKDGLPVERPRMSMTLICDHRVLNGAEAARFLARVREILERPVALAL